MSLTIRLYNIKLEESQNFGKYSAKLGSFLARAHNLILCRIWTIDVPQNIQALAFHSGSEAKTFFTKEDFRACCHFLCEMIDRWLFIMFLIVDGVLMAFLIPMPLEAITYKKDVLTEIINLE